MAWYEIAGYILGGSGIIGGIYKLFTMRVDKESIVIKNLKDVIDEIKENHQEYKKETEEKFSKLERKIAEMEIKEEINQKAISRGYRCPFPPEEKECPITTYIEKAKEKSKNKQ